MLAQDLPLDCRDVAALLPLPTPRRRRAALATRAVGWSPRCSRTIATSPRKQLKMGTNNFSDSSSGGQQQGEKLPDGAAVQRDLHPSPDSWEAMRFSTTELPNSE